MGARRKEPRFVTEDRKAARVGAFERGVKKREKAEGIRRLEEMQRAPGLKVRQVVVTVRWRRGVVEEEFETGSGTVGEVLGQLNRRHPGLLRRGTFVDGRPIGLGAVLKHGAVLELR